MKCKHFGVCGGCTLPAVPYAEQLAKKRSDLSRLLALRQAQGNPERSRGVGIDVPPFIPSPLESGFRSKVAFVFGASRETLIMGHYALPERGRGAGQRIIPIEECPVHHERGNRIAFALRDRLARARIAPGILRHIVIRTTADGREASAMLVVTRNDKSLRTPIRGLLSSPERPDGFFVNIHTKPGPYMVGDETIKIEGRSHVKEVIGGISYLVSPTAFFQTNVGVAEILVQLVVEAVGQSRRVLDLYSGSGLFSLPLAKTGAMVTAVEENRQAVVDAESNVRLNRLPGPIRFVASRVEDALARIGNDAWDAVVLDPPRQGCPPAVLAAVFERIRPSRAVYVSCNPGALATELPGILKSGYNVKRVQPVDMFPHTDHIETVMTFERGQLQ